MKFTLDEMMAKLPLPANDKWKDGVWDLEPFTKDNVKLVFFAPHKIDYQDFHEEDEFYFIVRGSGEIIIGEERFTCQVGDTFFVSAKTFHRFENFTEDFATWAIFF
jgi:mannose-6-phosphate isomerase-like protein (cupin superfamily)